MARHTREELDVFVKAGREAISRMFRSPLSVRQQKTNVDRGVRGARWVSRDTFPAPREDDALRLLITAVEDLGDGSQKYTIPSLAAVPVQWTAYRPGIPKDAPEPAMTEQKKFESLTADAKSDMVIMYMYGGAHSMNGPATRREVATQLSQLTGARCVIIEPRLAPQHAFPSQQLDVLHAYLSLLYPPPGAFHAAIDPSNIILAGDSSGAKLGLTLIQTILAARRRNPDHQTPSLQFHGRNVPLPLPAGVTAQSPAFDMLGTCLPSWDTQRATDIFAIIPPNEIPPDRLWPTEPRRLHLVAELPTLAHPLLSPVTAADWTGSPPIFIAVGGGEVCRDGARVVAQRAAQSRVPVIYEEYELMPHNWPMLLKSWALSQRCMESWAAACVRFAGEGRRRRSSSSSSSSREMESEGWIWAFEPDAAGKLVRRPVSVVGLTEWSTGDVRKMVGDTVTNWGVKARMAAEQWKTKL